MALQIKVEVLAVGEILNQEFDKRKYLERHLQCIAEQKVFVYRVFGEVGESDEAVATQKALQKWTAGQYMAELDFRQGNRAEATFLLKGLTPIKPERNS